MPLETLYKQVRGVGLIHGVDDQLILLSGVLQLLDFSPAFIHVNQQRYRDDEDKQGHQHHSGRPGPQTSRHRVCLGGRAGTGSVAKKSRRDVDGRHRGRCGQGGKDRDTRIELLEQRIVARDLRRCSRQQLEANPRREREPLFAGQPRLDIGGNGHFLFLAIQHMPQQDPEITEQLGDLRKGRRRNGAGRSPGYVLCCGGLCRAAGRACCWFRVLSVGKVGRPTALGSRIGISQASPNSFAPGCEARTSDLLALFPTRNRVEGASTLFCAAVSAVPRSPVPVGVRIRLGRRSVTNRNKTNG
jgi:hypothetical protein